jgi:hypothetical protein
MAVRSCVTVCSKHAQRRVPLEIIKDAQCDGCYCVQQLLLLSLLRHTALYINYLKYVYSQLCYCLPSQSLLQLHGHKLNRGHLGRLAAHHRAHTLTAVQRRSTAAVVVQAAWRALQGRRVTTTARAYKAAATALQRVYRGHIARRAAARVRLWRGAKPGAPRLQLGLRLIRDTKVNET